MRGPRGGREAPPPPDRAAEFEFKRGELEIRIRCAEDEEIKPCADAALTLMDKFGSVATSLPEPSPSSPAAPAPVSSGE